MAKKNGLGRITHQNKGKLTPKRQIERLTIVLSTITTRPLIKLITIAATYDARGIR